MPDMQIAQEEVRPEDIEQCYVCQVQVLRSDKFCWNCGEPRGPAAIDCAKCKRKIVRSWKACPFCGNSREGVIIRVCGKCKKMFKTSDPDRMECYACDKKTSDVVKLTPELRQALSQIPQLKRRG